MADPEVRRWVELGLPYGERPRLMLMMVNDRARRSGSPEVEVAPSLTRFARDLRIDTNGPSLRHFRDQLARLSAALIRVAWCDGPHARQVNSHIVEWIDVWRDSEDHERVLHPVWLRLSEPYFQSLMTHSVPLDRRAVAWLKGSALALDLYAFLAQRLHRIKPRKPFTLYWTEAKEQFGPDYGRLRDFRANFVPILRQVLTVYPEAKIEVTRGGLKLYHSPPPVPPKNLVPGWQPPDNSLG